MLYPIKDRYYKYISFAYSSRIIRQG